MGLVVGFPFDPRVKLSAGDPKMDSPVVKPKTPKERLNDPRSSWGSDHRSDSLGFFGLEPEVPNGP